MSFKLLVESFSRTTSSTSSSNFTVSLPNPFYVNDYKYIRLAYAMLFNTMYNVDASNQNIDIKISGVSYLATVPVGVYNATTLAVALQTAMTSAIANAWSVVYNSNQLT